MYTGWNIPSPNTASLRFARVTLNLPAYLQLKSSSAVDSALMQELLHLNISVGCKSYRGLISPVMNAWTGRNVRLVWRTMTAGWNGLEWKISSWYRKSGSEGAPQQRINPRRQCTHRASLLQTPAVKYLLVQKARVSVQYRRNTGIMMFPSASRKQCPGSNVTRWFRLVALLELLEVVGMFGLLGL